ncbi:hypothetical protein AMTRI_Chr09g16440 [Amborella trichopoda]
MGENEEEEAVGGAGVGKEGDPVPYNGTGNNNNPSSGSANGGPKGKSCKGCLYYSSHLKSKRHNPRCVGVSRPLQQVPGYVIGESEMEASKDGRSLSDFKYSCLGYSVYLDNKNNSAEHHEEHAELPFCVGIEAFPQPRSYRPPNTIGDEFLSRPSVIRRGQKLVQSGKLYQR